MIDSKIDAFAMGRLLYSLFNCSYAFGNEKDSFFTPKKGSGTTEWLEYYKRLTESFREVTIEELVDRESGHLRPSLRKLKIDAKRDDYGKRGKISYNVAINHGNDKVVMTVKEWPGSKESFRFLEKLMNRENLDERLDAIDNYRKEPWFGGVKEVL